MISNRIKIYNLEQVSIIHVIFFDEMIHGITILHEDTGVSRSVAVSATVVSQVIDFYWVSGNTSEASPTEYTR